MNATFIQSRIDAAYAAIEAYEAARLAIAGGAASYSIDTGQTKTIVTELNINGVEKIIEALYNQCAVLEARLTGNGSVIVGPAF